MKEMFINVGITSHILLPACWIMGLRLNTTPFHVKRRNKDNTVLNQILGLKSFG